jgi:methionine synthase II (cobalamin-independent)
MIDYRTDVVGSLLRPAYLKDARADYEAGKLSNVWRLVRSAALLRRWRATC